MVTPGDHCVIDNINVTLKEMLPSILPRCDDLSVAVVTKQDVLNMKASHDKAGMLEPESRTEAGG